MKHLLHTLLTIQLILMPAQLCFGAKESQPAEKIGSLEEAILFLKQGEEAYFDMKLDQAYQKLNQAKKTFYSRMGELFDGEDLYKTHLFLALCYFSQKKNMESSAEIKSAYKLNPKKIISEKSFPPAFVAFFNKEYIKQTQGSHIRLEVHSTPPFSTVMINGFKMGMTPLVLTNWPKGSHSIIISKENYNRWKTILPNTKSGIQKINAELIQTEHPEWITKSPLSKAKPSASEETAALLKTLENRLPEAEKKSSIWMWPMLALIAGGVTYGLVASANKDKHERNPNDGPSQIVVSLP